MIALYSATLLLSAGLLFVVEPMVGKSLLPALGGAPQAWITTLLFFQAALLAGYAYSHALTRRLGPERAVVVHLVVLAGGLALLPLGLTPSPSTLAQSHPVVWVLGRLTATVGLPFVALAATGPLLQRLFARTRSRAAADPYFLYAASNVGSLAGLLAYPVALEPLLGLRDQARGWSLAYTVLVLAVCACAITLWRTASADRVRDNAGATESPGTAERAADASLDTAARAASTGRVPLSCAPGWRRRARWVALAFVPSSFLLGTTAFVTRDLAPVPLLWVAPLALYLVSFVVAFARRGRPERLLGVTRLLLPGIVIAVAYTMAIGSQRPLWLLLTLHGLALGVAALMCHAALARDRPPAGRLTEFYLWLALGGALGGVFNALLAPALFASLTEYPLAIVAACLLRPPAARARPGVLELLGADERVNGLIDVSLPALFGLAIAAALRLTHIAGAQGLDRRSLVIGFAAGLSLNFARRPRRFALAVAALYLASALAVNDAGHVLDRERTFFGIYRVHSDAKGYHELFDGTTLHGVERMGQPGYPVPLSYYNPSGPVAQVFAALPDRRVAARTAVVGLGSGAMACYARADEHWTFFEIDPAVAHIAQDPRLFTYLRDCPGHAAVVLGDARRSLTLTPQRFGVMALDAFSSDAIPVHLLTREALDVYLAHLVTHGVMLFHISNRYVDLRGELGALAAADGLTCRVQHARVTPAQASLRYAESTWVAMARAQSDLGAVATDRRWLACPSGGRGDAWSDQRSSLLAHLKLG